MNKCAGFNPYIFLPLAKLFGKNTRPEGLPQIGDEATSEVVWNTLGNTASIATALIGLKVIANKLARKELENKRTKAHENKINAMHAYSTPNTAPQVDAVNRVRELGVTKDASGADVAKAALPIILATPAAIALTNVVSNQLKDEEEEEMDRKLAEARNELDALHAKLLKLRLKKSASSSLLSKTAGLSEEEEDDDEVDGYEDEEDEISSVKPVESRSGLLTSLPIAKSANGWADKISAGYILAAALVAALTGATVYNLTKDKDKERKRKKLLEKQVFAQNLTNAPNQVELLLGKHTPFPTDESRQTYIKEISDSVTPNA